MIKKAVEFLEELKQNNSREWFLEHKRQYLEIKTWFDETLVNIIEKTSKFQPNIRFLTPPECTYRQNRDIRFSNDKSPYKTHLGANLRQGGKKNGETPGYYFQINSQGKLFVGGGWYIMDSKQLFKLRSIIEKEPKDLLKILNKPLFKEVFGQLSGEKLISSPRGFDKNNPNIELLKYKHYTAFKEVDLEGFTQTQFEDFIVKSFKAVSELVQYLTEIKNLEV